MVCEGRILPPGPYTTLNRPFRSWREFYVKLSETDHIILGFRMPNLDNIGF